MTTTDITLKPDLNDIREIYFRANNHKYFFGPETKRQSIYLVLVLIGFPFFAVFALNQRENWYFVLGCIFFSLNVYDFWKVAKPIITWKKSVLKFLKEAADTKVLELKYNDVFFIHIQDQNELKQEWVVIDRAILNSRFIWLFSNTSILLPKSSMREEEFIRLSNVVMEKVKNVEKE
jgi:hypothetical protein